MSGVGSRVSVTLEGEFCQRKEGIRLGFGQKTVRVRVRVRVNKGESLEFPSSSLLFSSLLFVLGVGSQCTIEKST